MEPVAVLAALAIPAAVAYAWARKAPLSLTFTVAVIWIFLVLAAAAAFARETAGRAFLDLAFSRIDSVSSGPWTWITSLFTHASFLHLLSNLIFLVTFAPLVEERIGTLRFGVLYLAGGLFATLVFALLHLEGTGYVLLGASGALSAVFGAFGRLYPRERIRLWIFVPLPPTPAITLVLGFVVLQLLLQPLLPGIAWEAHIAGVAFGFAVAPAILRLQAPRKAMRLQDVAALRPLAIGRDLEEAYSHLEEETFPEARRAWLERFTSRARCPRCDGPLRLRGSTISSTCGWKLRL